LSHVFDGPLRGTKSKPVPGPHQVYCFLTTSPNAVVAPMAKTAANPAAIAQSTPPALFVNHDEHGSGIIKTAP
jgi:hypothetical protein